MSKMVPFYHVLDVTRIERYYRIVGEVTKSNFLNIGNEYSIPCIEEPIKKGIIKEGDRMKLTFFANEDEVEDSPEEIKFNAAGVRAEVWDEASASWSLVYEDFEGDS
jgi:hypothetical protein